MRMAYLSSYGLLPGVIGRRIENSRGQKYVISHGSTGAPGRWQVRLVMDPQDFPVVNDEERFSDDIYLINNGRMDSEGNPLLGVRRQAESDGKWLIFLATDRGYQAEYSIEGSAKVIAKGYCGIEGRIVPYPIIEVSGPCVIRWSRIRRIGDHKEEWYATYDGGAKWEVPEY